VYPTIPLAGSSNSPSLTSPKERYGAVERLGKEGLLEWAVVDPGTTTFARYDDIERDMEDFVYLNPEKHIRRRLQLARLFGFHPA
jgi:3-keto-5-aminohexanoate cleavage enzyme